MKSGSKSTLNNSPGVSLRGTPFSNLLGITLYILIVGSIILFILWPTVAVLLESIYQNGEFSLHNYWQLFTDNRRLLFNSISVAGLSTIISVFLGLNIALFITHSNNWGKKLVFAVLLLTMISPPFVSSLAYIMLFGRRGIITYKLLGLTLNPYGWHGVVLMQSIGHASLAALIILGVLRGIDKSLEQASLDLGASTGQTLRKVTLPLARPGIIAATLLVFIQSLADFGTPIIIGGGFTVLATEAYLNVIGLYNLSKAAAMGTLLLLPALLMYILYCRVIGSAQFFSARLASSNYSEIKLSRWINCALAVITGSFILFEIVQYITILWGAFAQTWGVDFSLSLKNISALNAGHLSSFARSLRYALIAALAGSFIGVVLAYILERKKFWGYKALDFVATLPLMIPGPFLGIGYVLAFHNYPLALTGTAFIVIINCIYRQLPIGTKAGTAVLTQLDPELEYAARDLGARDMYLLKDIILPLLKPAFLVSFINTFTTTMVTIGAIIFLVVPGSEVVTVQMFNAIKTGDIGMAAVLANLIIFSTLIINITFSYFILRPGLNKKIQNEETPYVPSAATIK